VREDQPSTQPDDDPRSPLTRWAERTAAQIDGTARRRSRKRRFLLGDIPGPLSILRTLAVGMVVAWLIFLSAAPETQRRILETGGALAVTFSAAWRAASSEEPK